MARPHFAPQGNHPLGGLLNGFSVLDCLGCSTWEEGGAGLGTLGLPEPVARAMTREAGFTSFEVRNSGNPLNAFYEVRPRSVGAANRAVCEGEGEVRVHSAVGGFPPPGDELGR